VQKSLTFLSFIKKRKLQRQSDARRKGWRDTAIGCCRGGWRRRGAMAAHALGHGRHSIHHDGGVLGAEPDHAAAAARTRGRDGELGRSLGRHSQCRHVLCRGLCFTGVGTRRRPPRPQADAGALEPCNRRVHRADGRGGRCLAVFRVSRADGGVRRFFQRGNRAGGEPGPRRAPRLCPRLAQHRPARRVARRSADRRRLGGFDRQLPDPLLLHLGDDPVVDGFRVDQRPRTFCRAAQGARRAIPAQWPHRRGELAGASWPYSLCC